MAKIQATSPQLNLYFSDGSHPSPIGSYVAACVFYATLYGKSPVGLSRRIYSSQFYTSQEGDRIELDSLSETDAQTIQRSVWDAVVRASSSCQFSRINEFAGVAVGFQHDSISLHHNHGIGPRG